ncbi:MAG: TIGR02281 family clan AA aspartic protease [Proteobacteria bacterium]|nr:TIGR02281 family clan AA aspartic protease [Pseudomonadota bacterium]
MARLLGTTFAAIIAMLLLAHRFMGPASAPAATPAMVQIGASGTSSASGAYDPWSQQDSPHPQQAVRREVAETRIDRDGAGQFHLTARVNGREAPFLIDTGADLVAIGEAEARDLGINVTPDQFRPIMRTASGTGMAALVRIDRLEVAGRELHDVQAVVMQGLTTNLLGQSALKQLGKVELAGDRMVIKPI